MRRSVVPNAQCRLEYIYIPSTGVASDKIANRRNRRRVRAKSLSPSVHLEFLKHRRLHVQKNENIFLVILKRGCSTLKRVSMDTAAALEIQLLEVLGDWMKRARLLHKVYKNYPLRSKIIINIRNYVDSSPQTMRNNNSAIENCVILLLFKTIFYARSHGRGCLPLMTPFWTLPLP